jgi:hypothetical protein
MLLYSFVFYAGAWSVKFIFFIIITTLIHKSGLSLTEPYGERIQIYSNAMGGGKGVEKKKKKLND